MNVKGYLRKNLSTMTMILILVAFRWSFADQYRVPTGSMLPTIQIGDHIFTNKLAYDLRLPFTDYKLLRLGEPQRGDIAVFIFPVDNETNLVKRIVGLPGEHLRIEGDTVWINGERVNEKYLPTLFTESKKDQITELDIPKDYYFVMGDNRGNSWDSRYWGLVPRKNIKGRALGVLWNITFSKIIPEINLSRIGWSLI